MKFVCPKCHSALAQNDGTLSCTPCGRDFEVRGNIPIFTDEDEYWCNADRDVMHALIDDAEATGDWRAAVARHIPNCDRHVSPLYRADAQFLLPVDGNSRVLDAGSMWGGITVPLAQFCKEVYAVDKTWETLRFLDVRARQLGLTNITTATSSIHRLPFADGFFDCIILNGVLEWLGTEQDMVIDEHWDGKRTDAHVYKRNPEEMQLEGLKELHRVLRPGGAIYVAIENRVGLQYFFGYPDDHVNVRFASVVPRALANYLTKKKRNSEYRTYTYSPGKLAGLIERAGFKAPKLYSHFPHYNTIARFTPFSMFNALGGLPTSGDVPFETAGRLKVMIFSRIWRLVPGFLRKSVSPSLAVIAGKDESAGPSRLISALVTGGVVKQEDASGLEAVIVNNRFGNGNPVNHVVYDAKTVTPLYFCKIARRKGDQALQHEADMIALAAKRLRGTPLERTIPQIYSCGEVDGIKLQVARYIAGRPVGRGLTDRLRRIHVMGHKGAPGLARLGRPFRGWARKYWLSKIDRPMMMAIDWLAEFQKLTTTSRIDMKADGQNWLEGLAQQIKNNGSSEPADLTALTQALGGLKNIKMPQCMQHGDFDICNLHMTADGLIILDFEHAVENSSPLFDLANLIFSPLLQEWRHNDKDLSLPEYAAATGWNKYLRRWLERYAARSGLPLELLQHLPALGVLEQNAKIFPETRDPHDYPMFGRDAFEEMLSWTLEL